MRSHTHIYACICKALLSRKVSKHLCLLSLLYGLNKIDVTCQLIAYEG